MSEPEKAFPAQAEVFREQRDTLRSHIAELQQECADNKLHDQFVNGQIGKMEAELAALRSQIAEIQEAHDSLSRELTRRAEEATEHDAKIRREARREEAKWWRPRIKEGSEDSRQGDKRIAELEKWANEADGGGNAL